MCHKKVNIDKRKEIYMISWISESIERIKGDTFTLYVFLFLVILNIFSFINKSMEIVDFNQLEMFVRLEKHMKAIPIILIILLFVQSVFLILKVYYKMLKDYMYESIRAMFHYISRIASVYILIIIFLILSEQIDCNMFLIKFGKYSSLFYYVPIIYNVSGVLLLLLSYLLPQKSKI